MNGAPPDISREARDFPLSWSRRRSYLLRRCPRSYFLHYYGARGGHEEFSEPAIRQLHLLKQLQSDAAYLNELFATELRDLFDSGSAEEPEGALPFELLKRRLFRRFQRDRRDMLLACFHADHRCRVTRDFYYASGSYQAYFQQLEKFLAEYLDRAELQESIRSLFATPPLRRLPLPRPLPLQLNDLTIYAAPLLAWREGENIKLLELPVAAEARNLILFLHKYYALSELKIPPEKVSSWELDRKNGALVRLPEQELDLSAAVDAITAEVNEMAALIRPDGTVSGSDFPGRREHCPNCKFKEYCEG